MSNRRNLITRGNAKMNKLWFTLFAVGLCSVSVNAQARIVKVSVVPEDNAESKFMGEMLTGKLGSTLRYAVVSEPSEEVIVSVTCLSTSVEYEACSIDPTYFPPGFYGLSIDLGGNMAVGKPDYVAQSLFDGLVAASTDEKLDKKYALLSDSVSSIQRRSFSAGVDEGKKACKPSAKPD
jgi:hypothetical protein